MCSRPNASTPRGSVLIPHAPGWTNIFKHLSPSSSFALWEHNTILWTPQPDSYNAGVFEVQHVAAFAGVLHSLYFLFFFCFFSPFLFLPTTICRIDADHYEITYAKGKAKCGLATWDFLRFPREKGGMKQEPFWNTHNRGLDIFHNYTICKCVAFLVLLLKRYCNSKGI